MAKARIMVVEDERIVALDIKKRLEKLGYVVIATASTAAEAVRGAIDMKPDLALVDIALKGEMDGTEAAKKICDKAGTPIVYLTACSDEKTLERIKTTEPYGYLLKPVEDGDLRFTVEMALHKHSVERELKESQRKFQDITSCIGEGIYVVNESGELTFMNPEAEHLLGWAGAELLGKKVHDIIHPLKENGAPLPLDECSAYKVIKTGKRQESGNDVFVRKDGVTFPVSLVSTPVLKEGKVVASITVFQDAARKQKREEDVLSARKLESIGILAGGIAHDFNNILTAILGNISYVKMFVDPGDKLFRSLAEAENAALQARALTHRLLTFARGGEPVRRVADIAQLIGSSASFACSGSKVMCEVSVAEGIWPVEVDEGQISQVIHNMVTNSRESMHNCGMVNIRVENAAVTPEGGMPLEEGRYIKIVISDEGAGMPKEHLARIFDPYFTTKERGSQRGAGFGLAICYTIIKNHGGLITAESGVGQGTTFTIFLPASEKEVAVKTPAREGPVAGKGKVLVMDDEEIIRLVAANMLNHLGYQVSVASSGEEAVVLFEHEKRAGRPFDAVILDLTVRGGMGGRETVKRLLEMDPGIKAIVSSGYSQDPLMGEYKNYGFKGVLPKPYKMEELSEVLRAMLEKSANMAGNTGEADR